MCQFFFSHIDPEKGSNLHLQKKICAQIKSQLKSCQCQWAAGSGWRCSFSNLRITFWSIDAAGRQHVAWSAEFYRLDVWTFVFILIICLLHSLIHIMSLSHFAMWTSNCPHYVGQYCCVRTDLIVHKHNPLCWFEWIPIRENVLFQLNCLCYNMSL